MRLWQRTISGGLAATAAVTILCASFDAFPAVAAAAVPNPCKVLPAARVVSATGYEPSALRPKETSQKANGGVSHSCTYRRGGLRLTVLLGPASEDVGGYGGPPGTVVVKEPSFGSKGLFIYDKQAKYEFATVTFVSGGVYFVISSSGIANAKILAVGKYLYTHP